jgi:hypothetical protein
LTLTMAEETRLAVEPLGKLWLAVASFGWLWLAVASYGRL